MPAKFIKNRDFQRPTPDIPGHIIYCRQLVHIVCHFFPQLIWVWHHGALLLMVKALLSAFLAHMKAMIYPCRSQICLKTLPFFVYIWMMEKSVSVIIFINTLPACSACTPGKNSNLWMFLAFIVENNALHSSKQILLKHHGFESFYWHPSCISDYLCHQNEDSVV